MIETKYHEIRDEMITIYDINLDYLKKIDYTKIIERNYNLEKILYIFICNEKEKLDYIYKGDSVMEKIREDFDHIKAALDELLYYNPEELERQADEYERKMARKEGIKEIVLKLKEKNYSIEEIKDITNLSYEEINNIQNTNFQKSWYFFFKNN